MTESKIRSDFQSDNSAYLVAREQYEIDFDNISESVKVFVVEEGNPYCTVENGILYGNNKTEIMAVPPMFKAECFEVPESVVTLGEKAFSKCHIKKVLIHNKVQEIKNECFAENKNIEEIELGFSSWLKTIGKRGFYGCENLKTINLDYSIFLESIEAEAFCGCKNLLNPLRLPDCVEYIGYRAFEGCGDLKFLDFPRGVKTIGKQAFNDCPIKRLYFSGVPQSIGDAAFGCDTPTLEEIEIPEGKAEDFKKLLPESMWYLLTYPKPIEPQALPDFIKTKDESGRQLTIATKHIVYVELENPKKVAIRLTNVDDDVVINRVDFIDWINYFK